MLTTEQQTQFENEGYVIVDEALSPGMLEPLRVAAERAARRTRSGQWPHRRTTSTGDTWGVQNLLHPDLEEPIFLQYMASPQVLEVCRGLLGPDLRMGLLNLLINPERNDFAIGWHRDFIRRELPADEEDALLRQSLNTTVQWNTAIYPDECLLIVPGSHNRASTDEEREVQFHRPMDHLSRELRVQLKPGQGVYYNPNLVHRGIYAASARRATLHAALTNARTPVSSVYYHGVRWMEAPGFREALPAPLTPLYEEWLRFAVECRSGENEVRK